MAKKNAETVDKRTGEVLTVEQAEQNIARKLSRLTQIRQVEEYIKDLEEKLVDQRETARGTKAMIDDQRKLLRKLITTNPEEEFDFDAEE